MIINLELTAKDVTVKSGNYNKVEVEISGIELNDVITELSATENGINGALNEIGSDAVAGWISEEDKLTDILDNFDSQDIFDYLKSKGWKMEE